MHPSSILSYYPTYSILDEVLSLKEYDTLYIYIDLKNNLQSIYMEHTIVNIVENTKMMGRHDTSIFTSLISFLAFHKKYASKRHIKVRFVIFFESGQSYYHQNLSKKYKISRRIDDLYGLDAVDRELFFDVLRNNLNLIEKSCSRLPNIKIARLLNLEADFIPYYLTTRNIMEHEGNNVAHIVYSNDHDLFQCCNDDCYQFSKTPQKKKIVRKGEVMEAYFKEKTKYGDEILPLAMAIIGDPGDDVYGVKQIGAKRLIAILDEVLHMVGGIQTLYDNVMRRKPIFVNSPTQPKNKYLNKVIKEEEEHNLISTNLKLVSFELISRFFDDPDTTENLDRRRKFISAMNKNDIVDLERMRYVLEMHRIDIQEDDLDVIYFD